MFNITLQDVLNPGEQWVYSVKSLIQKKRCILSWMICLQMARLCWAAVLLAVFLSSAQNSEAVVNTVNLARYVADLLNV